jgi:hypothetical protein
MPFLHKTLYFMMSTYHKSPGSLLFLRKIDQMTENVLQSPDAATYHPALEPNLFKIGSSLEKPDFWGTLEPIAY